MTRTRVRISRLGMFARLPLAGLMLLAGGGCSSTEQGSSDQGDPRDCMRQGGAAVVSTSTDNYGKTVEFRLPHGGRVRMNLPKQANGVRVVQWLTLKQQISAADEALVDQCFPVD